MKTPPRSTSPPSSKMPKVKAGCLRLLHKPCEQSARVRRKAPRGNLSYDNPSFWITDDEHGALSLKGKLQTKKNIVIVSGAGTSTNAGGEYDKLLISRRLSECLPN
jgi:hypothetical protein